MRGWFLMSLIVLAGVAPGVLGQVIGAGGQGALFEPEIDVVNSGAILDVVGTVSADRKYVTMTMRPQLSALQSLQTFTFTTGGTTGGVIGGGVVGGLNPVIANGNLGGRLNAPMRLAAGNGGAILLSRGITPLVVERGR